MKAGSVITNMKKTELHLHLDGSMRPASAWDMAKERGLRLPVSSLTDCEEMMHASNQCDSLLEYFKAFEIPAVILQDQASLERTAYELIETLYEEHVIYAEIRFAPQLHTEHDMTQKQSIDAVIRGCRRGEKDFPGIITNTILCALAGDDPKSNRNANFETIALAGEYLKKGVAGVDLAGGEGLSPIRAYRELFVEAYRMGVPFTIHAGEAGGAENVKEAVSWGARRIGHGCRIVESEEVMDIVKSEEITLEMCLTSNVQTKAQASYQAHSIRRIFDHGIQVCANTDNRTVSNINLYNEYMLLNSIHGFTEKELVQMNYNAISAAFIGNHIKQDLLNAITQAKE